MAVTKYASIIGWGYDVPVRVMTNAELPPILETSDEWIRSRTGIGQRHVIAEGESCSTLAIRAGRKALAQAGVAAWQLDLIIVATATPDYLFPSTACLVQEALGAGYGSWGTPSGGRGVSPGARAGCPDVPARFVVSVKLP
jgi:3-oxoacyl-[acyl-carrier-protein] synthase-3